MPKVTYEQYAGVLEEVNVSHFNELEGAFSYVEEGETIPVSKGGFQKEIRFGLEEHHSFGMVARLGKVSPDKETPVTLEIYVRVREDGKWKDYYDGILVPQYIEQAKAIATASEKMLEKIREALSDTEVLVIDNTNLPIESWEDIRRSGDKLKRCKRLYMLTQM